MSMIGELKRRNVIRVATAYVVAAWLLIQVAETLFPLFGFDDTPARIVVIVMAIGFIPSLVFAWVFEITPEGLKRERDVDRSESITAHTAKRLDRGIIIVLALALGYFAFDKFVLTPQREAALAKQLAEQVEQARHEGRSEALIESFGDQSIAVLAFEDMSPEKDQAYLSDGIAEELLNLLAKIPDLRVISRSSAFSYKGKDVRLAQIAEELNVAHVLEGSVRKAGDRVRITAQLIEARSDTHLWSETYDRTLDDIFEIQDEIAEKVVEQLKITLLGEAPNLPETDPELYTLYLQAQHLKRQLAEGSLNQAQELLERVIAADPRYVPALDSLITVYLNQAVTGVRDFAEGFRLARELATSGLETDPGFGPLYAQLGWIEMYESGDLQAAADDFTRSIELAPGRAETWGDTATLLFLLGRLSEAIELTEHVTRVDPLSATAWFNHGMIVAADHRWNESVTALKTVLRLSPNASEGHYYLALSLLGSGAAEEALREIERESIPERKWLGKAVIYPALGLDEQADAALEKLIAIEASPVGIAKAYAVRGENNPAFEWLETAIQANAPELAEVHVDPWLASLKSDPRWIELVERLGRSPQQLQAIRFDFVLPDA